jgi:hypothetical protein
LVSCASCGGGRKIQNQWRLSTTFFSFFTILFFAVAIVSVANKRGVNNQENDLISSYYIEQKNLREWGARIA